MSEEKKLCLNCKRDIPSSNFEMHGVHCQRNILLCPMCSEPVPRSELENHKIEFHSNVTCPECYCKLESSELSAHKAEICPKRIISCKHCDLELKADDIPEHEDYCGTKTEPCEGCGKFIMIKFQELHLNSNHTLKKPDDDCSDNSNEKSDDDIVDAEELFGNNYSSRYGRNANAMSKKRGSRSSNKSYAKYGDYDKRNRNLNDLNQCDENIRKAKSAVKISNTADNSSNEHQYYDVDDETYIPCQFCKKSIIVDNLIQHQTGCRPELVSYGPSNSSSNDSWLQPLRRKINSPSVYEISDDDDDVHNVLIPCEFCNKHFPISMVSDHQISCQEQLSSEI